MRVGYLRVQDNSGNENVHTGIVEKLNVEKEFIEKGNRSR